MNDLDLPTRMGAGGREDWPSTSGPGGAKTGQIVSSPAAGVPVRADTRFRRATGFLRLLILRSWLT